MLLYEKKHGNYNGSIGVWVLGAGTTRLDKRYASIEVFFGVPMED